MALKKKLRRSEARLRLIRRYQSQRWAGETPSEGWSLARTLVAPPDPRTGRTTEPRSPWTSRVRPNKRQPSSAMSQEVASACWAKVRPEVRGTPRTPVRVRAKRRHREEILLLPTLL